ncbi:hypothetical protein F2Q69_00009653 [Brassica cretica]|uniref:Uncharacterized protein n=1 Tax=Brassica cretica TaxID=69181 RepID=A0A8S9NZJ6_BRACR|nr:hypothetical protein F2Q69_00009653 [Brassica cretica]
MELMKGGMKDHARAEALIPPIDGRIQGFWDPIPVSPDTVETTTEFPGNCGEVDRPADAFGASLSGNFILNLERATPRFTLGFKVCAVTSRLSIFQLRFLLDSYRFKVRDSPLRMKSLGECSKLNYGAPRRRIRSNGVQMWELCNLQIRRPSVLANLGRMDRPAHIMILTANEPLGSDEPGR